MNIRTFALLLILLAGYGEMTAQLQREAILLQHPDRIRVSPLSILNSPYRETNMSITPDGQYLFFMSLRGGQEWSHWYMTWGEDSVYDGDIWYAKKYNGQWSRPVCLPYGVNTGSGEDEPNVAPNGRKVYFQSWQRYWQFSGGPYYEAQMVNGKWGEGKGLGGGITEFFRTQFDATDGMTVSPDGKTFIVACGNDYHNKMDLYISKKGPRGWSYLKRLGISTPRDERSVFIAADGKTLYFASDGYGGYGGLDIFKTTLNPDGSCGKVINLGKPFNTPGDDYGFILTGDGKEGYFIRNGDIYFTDLTDADPRMKPAFQISLKGVVKDSLSKKPMKAQVIIMDAKTTQIVKVLNTDDQGRYQCLLSNKDAAYYQSVKSKGYKSQRETLKTRETASQQTYENNFYLAKKENKVVPPPLIAEVKQKPAVKPKVDTAVVEKPEKRKFDLTPISPQENTKITINENAGTGIEATTYENPYSFENVAENNLILLLDVSASMKQADKLPLLKDAFSTLITHMRPEDRISLITYSGDARVLLDGVSAAEQAAIKRAIGNLGGGGSTNSKNGLKKAFKIADANFIPGGNNRIIFATDGYYNLEELYKLVEKGCAQSQVKMSIFSFGKLGIEQEKQFEKLADKGQGNHSNINIKNVDKALLQEAKAVRKK